ncbi:MAG: DNA-directed RNA polymerase subunit beta' [Bacillota bacterium]|nr:DNA-directed RNA polymerase subunit beta' [Bacillota bacterium]MDI9414924.1 DNA-directed RNA polymerase subunit beta' [Bacillota bacterium]NLD12134.1 DNA-directed RNA polymerase subunit beta' [Bacillota bacterium]HOB88440.1 DNA-directed RNA polymerase subunit beta' [Bacillota bacterium]HOJ57114.1 DNA-directed RNA polymerase subunit beta' [Bacillota bacterium]
MLDVSNFGKIRIGLASPEQIRQWSSGEVKKPETINYRTLKPEREGLFCEKIFGPTRDWECHCGKYKRVRYRGIVCDKCGVEVTRSKVRRERLGHIELAAPVSHIWYLKGIPSRMGLLLDLSPRVLEKVIYFAAYIVVDPGETPLTKKQLLSEIEYREMKDRFGDLFYAGMGAEAIKKLLEEIDLDELVHELRDEIRTSSGQKKQRAVRRLEVAEAFRKSGNRPEHMILDVIPVIPPDLRPMVQLDGGRFATSDLNDLYRRVINRNNRLKRLIELNAPDIIVRNEKRMLQEAVDALIDNGRRGRPVTGPGNRPLKSLSDMLKGKQGRFRQNLLGKRVDYSGRSVIVIGPELKLHQCGLPKEMALELFKPFVMKKLVENGYAHNIKSAKRMVERVRDEVWDVLEDVIKDHPVLLNRAPTLHRLGIQAFEPVLVEGKAIQIHPLVCPAYNADFDGDQMAVHVPLSAEAQAEARLLMLSVNNLLSPAHGKPIATPGQDLVLGCYYLTIARRGEKGEGKFFASPDEAYKAYKEGAVKLHSLIAVRMPKEKHVIGFTDEDKDKKLLVTTVGRLVFNRIFPDDFPYINDAVESTVDEFQYTGAVIDSVKERPIKEIIEELPLGRPVRKGFLVRLISMCHQKYGNTRTSVILDNLKTIGFRYATQSGTTVGVEDIVIPDEKDQIIKEAEKRVEEIEQQHRRGLITNDERYQLVIDSWTEAKERIQQAMLDGFDELNPVYMMAISGARGNVSQLSQLAGMRGLVADPSGRTIDFPIKANFREGLTVLEYFSSTHGTRKGLADTALRTADSGYLTRRLVDVAQDVIVREEDCGTDQGITLTAVWQGDDVLEPLRERIVGRVACEDIVHPDTGEVIIGVGCEILEDDARRIELAGITEVTVRSPLTCRTRYGVCVKCYGRNLATGNLVEVGEAVGIIAAQSIGEPGTQLTMRTFHTGGVAGDDITHGLPRVEELFEARKPKGQALISEIDGHVSIVESKGTRKVVVRAEDGEEKTYTVPYGARLEVREGQFITAGDQITEGSLNPHDILRVKGVRAVQSYLVREVQEVYRSQGVEINDKHIEVVIRQMLRKVKVEDPGDTDLLPGGLVDVFEFEEENARVMAEGKQPAIAKPVILGITKASLATDSFLSAASFQETTRVLTDASIKGRMDPLIGLKENVIIGKLIPAGTGMSRYRNVVPVSHVAEAAADSEDVLEYSDDSLGEDAAVSE